MGPELSQDVLYFDNAPEKSRMYVVIVGREGRFKKLKEIRKLPSFLTYLVHVLKQTVSCCEFAQFAEG